MFLHGLGSPLLALGKSMAKPIPHGTPELVIDRRQVVQACLTLFALSLLASIGMVALFYPSITQGDLATGELARNIGFGAGVLGFSLTFLTMLYRHYAHIAAPIYALAGGLFMSGLALSLD